MRAFLQPRTISVLACSAFAALLLMGGVPDGQLMAGMDVDGVTIPIQPLVMPLRREDPKQTPIELRPTIRELPREAPQQRLRKPSRTQFADMDLAFPAG